MDSVEKKFLSGKFPVEHSSYWHAGGSMNFQGIRTTPCDAMLDNCEGSHTGVNSDGYAFLARGYLSSERLRDSSSGFTVHVPLHLGVRAQGVNITKETLNELQSGITTSLPPLSPKLNSALKAASAMVSLHNGCITVKGCRLLASNKVRFAVNQERCTGYTDDQIVSNQTHCIFPPRGNNRQRVAMSNT